MIRKADDLMYTLDKLKNMSNLLSNGTVDGELASYFVNNLNNLSTMTLQKCMKDTGISKASIHRFYSKAGFINFKNFISVLSEEVNMQYNIELEVYKSKINYLTNYYDFSYIQDSSLLDKLKNADKIFIYGNIRDMYNLSTTINYLRQLNKKVLSLNMWEIELNYEKIKSMKSNDVLIIINNAMNIQNFYEQSINNDYLLNLEIIRNKDFQKFYIGQGNIDKYLDFEIIKIPDYGFELSFIIMNILDKYIYKELKKVL